MIYKEDLISVIVPIYNVERYLEECVSSIQNQSYKNLEIILIDDGSADNSGKIADDFLKKDSRIKVIHFEKSEGPSKARNYGIDLAKGEYIMFVDSDDYIDLNMIQVLHDILLEHNADISMCLHYGYTDEKGYFQKGDGEILKYTRVQALQEILMDKKIQSYAWGKLYNKNLFAEVRFPEGEVFEDIQTIPKLLEKAEKIVMINASLYYYRQHEDSIMHTPTIEKRLQYIKACEKVRKYLLEIEESLDIYCKYNLAHITVNTFNDIVLFDMYDMLNEKIVVKLYEEYKEIFKNSNYMKFIIDNSSPRKVAHLFTLYFNKDVYLKEHEKVCMKLYDGWGPAK